MTLGHSLVVEDKGGAVPSYYYSSKFARPAQILVRIPPAKRKGARLWGKDKPLINDFHPQSPNFARFASLRETLRVSVAAQPRWVLRGEIFLFFFFIQLSNDFSRHTPVDDVIGLNAAGFLLGAPQRRLDEIHDRFVRRASGVAKRFHHLRH